MKRMLTAVLVLMILLAGCQAAPEAPAAAVPETAAAGAIELSLPDGFSWNPLADGNYELLRDGQVVGGFAKSDLIKTDMEAYLQSYVQPPLVMEYIWGSGKDNVWWEVSLIAYDTETQTAHEVSHYLFDREGAAYDLFLDNALLEWETEKQILVATGLYMDEE